MFSKRLNKEQADLRLRKLEDKLRYYKRVVIDSSDAVIIQDFNGIIKAWNKGAERIYGFKAKEILGKNILKIIAPENRAEARRNIHSIKQGKPSFRIRQTRITKDKQKVFVNITYSPIYEYEEIIEIGTTEEDVSELKKKLEVLKESEEKFRAWSENLPVGFYQTTPEGNCTYANKKWLEMAGLTLPQALGNGWVKGLHPDDRKLVLDKWKRMVKSRGKWGFEYRFVDRKGKITWVYGRAMPLYDQNKKIIGYVGSNSDITEQKVAKEALKESRDKFELIIKNSPDHIVVQDRDLRYEFVLNPQLGLTEKEMIGKTEFDILSKKDAIKLTNIKKQVLNTGKPKQLMVPLLSKKGEIQYFEGTYIPRYNSNNEINGIFGYFKNITLQKNAENRIKVSELKFRRLFEAAQDSILILNAQTGLIEDSNPFVEKMLGYSKKELLGKHLWQISHFKNVIANKEKFIELQNNKYIRYDNLPLQTKSGKTVYVEFVSNVYGINGDTVVQCNIRDITERKRVQDELNRSKEELELRVRERTVELNKKVEELERFNKITVGRELKMIELKKKISILQAKIERLEKKN